MPETVEQFLKLFEVNQFSIFIVDSKDDYFH